MKSRLQLRRYVASALAGCMMMAATPAFADFSCQVSPSQYLAIDGVGFLVLISGKHVKPCSFTQTAGDITPEVCKVWFSYAVTAKATGKPFFLAFHDYQTAGATSCSSLNDWTLTPAYFLETQ